MDNRESKKHLKKFLDKVDSQQDLGPFNIRDSGIQEELHEKLSKGAVQYDDEPVTACPLCKGLYLKEIDDRLECFNCGNELEEKDVIVYRSIYAYLKNESSNDTDDS